MADGLTLRPYEALCLFCSGAGAVPEPQRSRLARAADAIHQRPDLPVTLRCLAQDVYTYQDVEVVGSVEFARRRDLTILYMLDLPPGATLPARTLLFRIRKAITTTAGLCGHEGNVSPAWQGCPLAFTGQFERGVAMPLETLVPARTTEEMARDKAASVAAMEAGVLRIRPHVMMCAVCYFGRNQTSTAPLAADNIVEFIQIIRRRPDDVSVVVAPGADWMVCAPCPYRVPDMNACVNVAGSGGLSNEKRDLDLLQILDLQYEDALSGREMLRLLFTRVPDTSAVCRRASPELSVWWDGCGQSNCAQGNDGYAAGRRALMDQLQL